jgi:hypothetical protein
VRSVKIVVALGAAVAMMVCVAGEPASAITAELAKKCRSLALKAYPYKLVGQPGPGNAQAQRSYFSQCVAKQGNMPAEPTGAGKDQSGETPVPPE